MTDATSGHSEYTPVTVLAKTAPWADAVTALTEIQWIVHQKTARTEPALHHFQRDFDAIRKLCERVVGPFARATGSETREG